MTDPIDPSSEGNFISEELLRRLIAKHGFDPDLVANDHFEELVDELNRTVDADFEEHKRRTLEKLLREINGT